MSSYEQLAQIDSPHFPSEVAKAIDEGRWTVSNLQKLMVARARFWKVQGEKTSFVKSFTGQNHIDPLGPQLLSLQVNLEKAAPRNNAYGHGRVTTNSTSYDAGSDESGVARDTTFETMVSAHHKKNGGKKSDAYTAIMATPEGRKAFERMNASG